MPDYRLSQHGMDVVFKLEAEQLGAALDRRFGIDLPAIARHFPTDLPVADVHLEQLDSVFELVNEWLLHLEFQTEHRRTTLARFLIYDAYLYERYERPIITVVIYGAGVAAATEEIDANAIRYQVYNVLLGQEDGRATYQRLKARVASGNGLTPEDRLDLIFLPLMKQRRARRNVVRDALALARQLPEDQQRQTLASLIGLGHRFLTGAELDTVMEGLMITPLGQRLLDKGTERGRREDVLQILTERFGPLPTFVEKRLTRVDDIQRLRMLLSRSISAQSLDEFVQALEL